MKKLLCFMMITSIILSIYFISDISIQNVFRGNFFLDKEKVWELGLAISIGIFSSALLALLIEFVNERNKKIERDRILREMMWEYFIFNKHQLVILDKNELAKGTLFYLSGQMTLNVFIEDYVKETYEKSRKYLDLFYLYSTFPALKIS